MHEGLQNWLEMPGRESKAAGQGFCRNTTVAPVERNVDYCSDCEKSFAG
jgi:hypothetical protein